MDRDHQPSEPGTTRTAPGTDEQRKPAARKPEPADAGSPATSAPDIMSRLPKTRPQRSNDRRRAAATDAPKPPAPARSTAAKGPTAPTRSARKPAGAPKRPAAARGRTAAAPRGAAATPAAPKQQARPKAAPAPKQTGGAPSIPRLAVDGATEAVKLPLKVGGRLTLRALDAVARGLRRG